MAHIIIGTNTLELDNKRFSFNASIVNGHIQVPLMLWITFSEVKINFLEDFVRILVKYPEYFAYKLDWSIVAVKIACDEFLVLAKQVLPDEYFVGLEINNGGTCLSSLQS